MSPAVVLTVAFLIVMGVTLVFPSFPPAQIMYEYLKMSTPTMSMWGFSVASLLNGITNGFFWVIIAAIVYSMAHIKRQSKPLPPMPVAPKLSAPPPEPTLVDPRVNIIPPALTVTPYRVQRKPVITEKAVGETEQDIETIDGIGPVCAGLFRNSGINTVADLLRVGAKEQGRRYLAGEVGVTYATLLKWIYRGDLLRVKGVGRKYATLLESAGVNTVSDLSKRTPRYLSQTLKVVNRERNLVRRAPPSKTIEIWVNNARDLEPLIE